MKNYFFLFLSSIAMCMYTACASFSTNSQGFGLLRESIENLPVAQELTPDGQKIIREYRLSIPLYKW
ncbi:MAG: hypothetical protein N2316_13645 [Spirochaetes bacterium]|nr:hypothetical protein [Spirochaetota bacterium]